MFQGKEAEKLQTEIDEMELERKKDQEDQTFYGPGEAGPYSKMFVNEAGQCCEGAGWYFLRAWDAWFRYMTAHLVNVYYCVL